MINGLAIPDGTAVDEPRFPEANDQGIFAADDCQVEWFSTFDAHLLLIEQEDGWRWGAVVALPEAHLAKLPPDTDDPCESRAAAEAEACEYLVGWLSTQKLAGSKKHRAQAEDVQNFVLDFEARTVKGLAPVDAAKAAAEPHVFTEAEAALKLAPLPGDLPTGAKPEGELRRVSVSELHESPWNPRELYPAATLAALTESMRTGGFWDWSPLIVRPRAEGGYEIGAGHRRFRAAQAAGLVTVPVIVREIADEQFLDLLNFDNSGREDVHPLHEAAGWADWMRRTGRGVADIAQRIGKSIEYVYQRLKYAELIDAAKLAFLTGEITAGHAILIARRKPADQEKCLKYCEPSEYHPGHRKNVRDLASFIARDIHRDMESACFDLKSETLAPVAGACSNCRKRTSVAPELSVIDAAADDAEGLEPESDDQCTDLACFESKVKAHLMQIKSRLSGDVIEVSSGWGKSKKNGPIKRNDYEIVGPGAPGAKTALLVDGFHIGKIVMVKVKTVADTQAISPAEKKAKEERSRADAKAKVEREMDIRRKILAAVCDKVGSIGIEDIRWLLNALFEEKRGYRSDDFSLEELCRVHGVEFDSYRAVDALQEAVLKMPAAEITRLAIEASVMGDFCQWKIRIGDEPELLLALAERYRVDAAKVRRGMEEVAKEAEGGTRREVKEAPKSGASESAAAKSPRKRGAVAEAKKTEKNAKAKPAKKKLTPTTGNRIKRIVALAKAQAARKGGR